MHENDFNGNIVALTRIIARIILASLASSFVSSAYTLPRSSLSLSRDLIRLT